MKTVHLTMLKINLNKYLVKRNEQRGNGNEEDRVKNKTKLKENL